MLCKDGYPVYAQSNDGHAFKVGKHIVNNRWIVLYNPYLLSKYDTILSFMNSLTNHVVLRYDAHINVECVMSLAAAKYITKYTHKGSD
jgi:hypothetical protein